MRCTLSILLLLISITPSFADSAATGPTIDAASEFGLVHTTDTQVVGEANRAALQAKIDAGAPYNKYPWFFASPGGLTQQYYRVENTIIMRPLHGGRLWHSNGVGIPDGTGNSWTAGFCNRSLAIRTVFDGSNKKLTSAGTTRVVTATGRSVVASDQYNSVYISGGANVTAGWYGVEAVDTSAGTWTLDRNWCTGAVTDGQATYVPTLIRDHGRGNVYRGLIFTAYRVPTDYTQNPTNKGSIGLHLATSQISVSGNLKCNTGKHLIENCAFEGYEVPVLCGRHLAQWKSSATKWVGDTDGHADTITVRNVQFARCSSGLVTRNNQSVVHRADGITVNSLAGHVFHFDSGGRLVASNIHLQSGSLTQPLGILRIGTFAGREAFPCVIRGVSFDGGNSCPNPQLLLTDWEAMGPNVVGSVVFDGVSLNRAPAHADNIPLIDAQGKLSITVRNLSRGNAGIWNGSIRLQQASEAATVPYVLLQCCDIDSDDPEDVLHSDCDPGATIEFIGCRSGLDGELLMNGRYIVGTGWVHHIRPAD
jgi:hypothetical protein